MITITENGEYLDIAFPYDLKKVETLKKAVPRAWWEHDQGVWKATKFWKKQLEVWMAQFQSPDVVAAQPPQRYDAIPPLPELTREIPLLLEPFHFQKQGIAYILEKRNTLIGDQPGLGKAQPLTAKIATANGWVYMGQLKDGDPILGADGLSYNVAGIFPQGMRPTYRITMNDGSFTEADADHLWQVRDVNRRKRDAGWIIKTTAQLLQDGLFWNVSPSRAKTSRTPILKWEIPMMRAFGGIHRDHIIAPYIMGALLGDGYICGKTVTISIPDKEIETAHRIGNLLPASLKMRVNRFPACPQYDITQTKTTRVNPFKAEINRMHADRNGIYKFIPQEYLFSSYAQRLDLLRGLMDTDGSCIKNRTTFHTVSENLANDVAELVFSLGGQAIIRDYDRTHEDKRVEYQVNVRLDVCPFYMQRKVAAWRPAGRNYASRYIAKIEYIGLRECQCIKVTAPDSLYVTDSYIVTHNTGQAIAAVYAENLFPCLVICPNTLKENWRREWEKWTGKRAMILSDKVKSLWHRYWEVGMFDIFIVNYESLEKYFVLGYDKPPPGKEKEEGRVKYIKFRDTICSFQSLIVDESHKCKNELTRQTKLTAGISRGTGMKMRLCLSGTAMVNGPADLWPQLVILGQHYRFGTKKEFVARYCEVGPSRGPGNLKELNYYLNMIGYYRREKRDVLKDLPPKVRTVWYCDITTRKEYDVAEQDFIHYLQEVKQCSPEEQARKLRGGFMVKMGILKNISARGKLNEVRQYVENITEAGEKVVLFGYLKTMVHEMAAMFSKPLVINGDISMADRQRAIDLFQTDASYNGISCNTESGGVGLTLTAASRVGIVEEPYTFASVEQCEDRVHRVGQRGMSEGLESIESTIFLGKDTIDEYVHFDIVMRKKDVQDAVLGAKNQDRMEVVDGLLKFFKSRNEKQQKEKANAF